MPDLAWEGEPALLPPAAAYMAGGPFMEEDSVNGDHTMRHVLHRPAELHLHPSTLALSEYPTVGGGVAELVFTVTYAGDMRQDSGDGGLGPAEPPLVRLDVTGSEHSNLYRVTNIKSNVGTAAADIFEAYDFETETVRAKQGATYTVRATIEFVAEGFIPVYAIGFDGDIVTVNVAASELESMSYDEYVSTRQDYLDSASDTPTPRPKMQTRAHALEKLGADDPLSLHSPLLSSSTLPPIVRPFTNSTMTPTFNVTGTVKAENYGRDLLPVHGIRVCVYDESPRLDRTYYIELNTTSGEPACGYTDTNGSYAIRSVIGFDSDDETPADVYVSVSSIGYGGSIRLEWYDPEVDVYGLYYAGSNTVQDYRGSALVGDFNLYYWNTVDFAMSGAAGIISTISDGMAFFEEYGQDPVNLTVRWNHLSESNVFPDKDVAGAAYHPREATIYLDGDVFLVSGDNVHVNIGDSHDRHTIFHEFGHHVHLAHDPGHKQDCQIHFMEYKYDEACAWGEGWAQLVPHLVSGDAEVARGVKGIRYNLEAGHTIRPSGSLVAFDTFEASGRPIGEKVEGSVAAAMWDMADDAVNSTHDISAQDGLVGRDASSAGVDGLLDVFFGGTYDTFADFYDRWEIDMRDESAEDIAILHGMSFAIPSNMSYYEFVDELDALFYSGPARLLLQPNYIDVSGDGSTVAVTSRFGNGIQMVDARGGEHKGLYATHGYNYECTLTEFPLRCIANTAARGTSDLAPAGFSSMDGIAFGLDSNVVVVSDGQQNRVQILGSDGKYLGHFGSAGNSSGEFLVPDGVTFLADNSTAAVADAVNSRIQTFAIAGDGSAEYDGQFTSYDIYDNPIRTTQQLATGPDGAVYAAGLGRPSIWIYPPPPDNSSAIRIDDPSLCGLGGIDVDDDGLIYISDLREGKIRVYDPNNLRGDVDPLESQLGDRPLMIRQVKDNTGICGVRNTAEAFIDEFGSLGGLEWQLRAPFGVALGPPDASTGDVRVYVADLNGVKMYEKDRDSPRIESVWAHTSDGTVVPGDTVEIAVNFSERVTVTGTPVLALDTGVTGSNASYVSGSGSATLTFNYTVVVGVNQLYIDYNGTRSMSVDGGDSPSQITDGSGNIANLTLPERGTAASLAANAALWVSTNRTDVAPFGIAAMPTVAAVEHQLVKFNVTTINGSEPVAGGSYVMIGGSADAMISDNGTFTWTPDEADNGVHAFAVRASQQGDANTTHARTFRIQVAENNTAPVVEPVINTTAVVLSELRFDIDATDEDLPEQDLWYWLASDRLTYATVLPNGTFMWTPSEYDLGTTEFNVTVGDGFDSDTGDDGQDSTTSVVFSVTVEPIRPSPLSVYALAPDGSEAAQDLLYAAGQTIRIAVEFSEPVAVTAGSSGGTPYLELIAGDNSSYRAPYASGGGSSTLVFAYTTSEGDAADSLSYAGAEALDLNGGTIASVADSDVLASTTLPRPGSSNSLSGSNSIRIDAVRPTVELVYAPDGNMAYDEGGMVNITVMFSENVSVTGSPTIMLETGETDRDAVYLSGDSTSTLLFNYTVLAGDNSSLLDYTGTGALRAGTGASIRDAAGNDADLTLPAPGGNGSLSASARISIGGAGQLWTGEGNVTLSVRPGGISGTGNVTAGGNELRVTLHLGYIAPGDNGTAMFPPDGATVNATFATVTFPPSATATSVPADDRIVLYVVNRTDLPDNSTVQEAMEYEGSGRVMLNRVVEIGDEAGRINFDTPVRISLEGQANGRAFYIEAGGPMTPIDLACAADDTGRVHLQMMDSMGECQLDSEEGDKVIYTYHLTRFGTVSSEGDAPPPVLHTCSASIDETGLGVTATPGGQSRDAAQAVANRGSLPFDRVELNATPWRIDMGGAQPGSNSTSLPANVTEVREKEGGAYRMVGERGTFVAQGLDGGTKASLWFRVNLAAHGGAQSGDLAQTVAYLAECAEPAWRQ